MCGITGWIDWERDVSVRHDIVEAMTRALTNRGPDEEGYWYARSSQAAFGHRRLIVVDPAGGRQPMTRQRDGQEFTLVYNGELYNTEDVRRELLGRGYAFRSHSDTEVLLASYMEWGADCLHKLNGIYAFAVWEEHTQQLFLARDRLGVKPLFFAQRENALLFGSELKALLAHPLVKPVIGREGLAELFVLGPSRTPGHGVFADVHELKPGHYLTFNHSGLVQRKYWGLESYPHEEDVQQTAQHIRHLLADSIKRQLISDVPIATLLSGGLDSSAITAIAAQVFQEEGRGTLYTYSVDYVNNALHFRTNAYQPNDDAPFVHLMADRCRTSHQIIELDTSALTEALETALYARDLPGMADVDASLFLFCREIKKQTTVVLSGECADEMFGGYPWFHRDELLHTRSFPWAQATDERASWLSPELQDWVKPKEYMTRRYEEALDEVPRMPADNPMSAKRREMFYLNLTWFMSTLLDRKDRMSMAAGLEARVPYCDHRLIQYVWNIPWEMKNWGNREKGILRLALEGILPEQVLYRKKSPYPKTHNPAYAKATRSWLLQVLDDPSSPLHQMIDTQKVRSFAHESAEASGTPYFGQLMGRPQMFAYLASIDLWMRTYQVTLTS
ncbi:asparagine synthase (glutamine-hydrolyzing) [Brevibacillus ruminantium]|uniref:asparagine synthase (glutamine-hydrolyzing) n=1 Tax=Brevibacillus ruminantium TaxID=2950604 RepID=A0ABY4WA95_9BACL|nr:asparagine synthase (glutamine-hydrolyzing) [Brevibacillus ruminantium]USG63766.1 asparagine synthase (glutamine-hydrolyzing) [Brevibacillus ruminantium]